MINNIVQYYNITIPCNKIERPKTALHIGWDAFLFLSTFLSRYYIPLVVNNSLICLHTHFTHVHIVLIWSIRRYTLYLSRPSHCDAFRVSTKIKKKQFFVIDADLERQNRMWSHGAAMMALLLWTKTPPFLIFLLSVLLFLYLRQRSHLGNMAAHLK